MIKLTPYNPAKHSKHLKKWLTDQKLMAGWDMPSFWPHKIEEWADEPNKVILMVEDGGGEVVGFVNFYDWNKENKTASRGTLIDSKYQNKGYGKTAIKTSNDYAFDTMLLNRIELYVSGSNEVSRHITEKLGYKFDRYDPKKDRYYYYMENTKMKSLKVIIIGTSLSGKTTLIRLLRSQADFPISEMDEELTLINGGEYPADAKFKHEVLTPKVVKKIFDLEKIVFFTNTNYISIEDLSEAKKQGFKVIQLDLSLDELMRRNESRMKNEGYDDMGQWLEGMLQYQREIKKAGLVDKLIDANKSTELIAKELTDFIGQ